MTVIVISDLPNLAENSRQRPNTSEKIMAPKPVRRVSNHSGGAPATVETSTRSATVVEAVPRFEFVVPHHVREIGWMLGRTVRWVISTVAFVGIGWSVIWYFFGTTTVTAEMDGKPITANVLINGEVVGKTPYETRLYPGFYSFEVEKPKAATGVYLNEWGGFTVALGFDMNADFTTEIEPAE